MSQSNLDETLLDIRDVTVSIHGKTILDRVSVTVAPGEIVALTGESGSGKSMTALATIGLLPGAARVSGTIAFESQDLIALSDPELCDIRGRKIGMIFQEPMTALNPVKTIGSQVAETILVHTKTSPADAQKRAAQVLTRVGLPEDRFPLTRYPHELSGGQRQRVVIAMAIALRPRLLIADEPTTALDVTTQAQILDLLRDLSQTEGMAVLMITHDLAVVSDMADKIAVMKSGEIVEQAPTRQLFAQMSHPYTRDLFEASRHQANMPAPVEAPPLLQVQNVSCDYPMPRPHPFAKRPFFRAVRDVSFDIAQGERVGLVGESGCGKSTLTRALLGLNSVSAGSVQLDGNPVFTHGHPNLEVQRQVQVVFQDPYGSFNPRHRVRRLITEPFHLLPNPPQGAEREAAIAKALTDVGLSAADADKYPHAFSGGQRQRLAIARALIIRPKLIVFDEAVSALDVRVRAQILDLMADICSQYGLAYLFISHDLSVVRSITDRVLVMQRGEIVEHGPTEAVFSAPAHPYTQTLIAAAPRLPTLGDPNAAQPAL
ncbi:MAG: ABC transporter ATP-binding protein [Pelagimonas sp.]|uniref:ABC transporter ATP-binding protein n=1 Tax=Pelagimonas sp. TaxID=2073170 RepID=UPI003D6A8960